ncbi:SufB/SufD family protein [Ketogulonicigenium vulgare]|uniref:FeS assembly protein SufD, putative n=1 Tax=Ketogulonicigenium vulgare (strain WSH-001) TaxID=759362 RepID=F9Y5W1_KETVW|nr:SufD family Fe-S cluster assembly protein [Ketogulonicigenium vulgare]ADO42593.1 SufBD protein [Ketogulonicigenium vulgare Y25]AEM40786.1 FeS assembly protein SufD, putative [Ketogulonicigenium vulgare WSH-001]ALJ80953.1 Fe-S cluster assembly protein SufD [Ketogulonicigenium vulgare]ANW33721.1 Fe-S cluster assembly protein SufD [Ketogulonicigenium vulgare]AOZ54504.1 SufBD protein [Ketogulonicigenium vulgare]
MGLPKIKADTTTALLANLVLPKGAPWADAVRAAALARVETDGLPFRRDEYWRYSNPEGLTASAPATVAPATEDDAFAAREVLTITFVDGVLDTSLSDLPALEGVEVDTLATALSEDAHWAKDLFGTLEAKGQVPVQRPLAALNTAFAYSGLVLRVKAVVETPIKIIYRQSATAADAFVRHLIWLEEGAGLTLLEVGTGAARFNSVTEVEVADHAAFHHIRTQGRTADRQLATHMFAHLGQESLFKSFTLAVDGRFTRNECVIEMTGDDTSAHVAGVAVGEGRDFLHDDTIFITHDAVNCESRQVFKKVLRNAATGVFQGKILVKPGAQKTDGYQISQSLLLDEDANFLAKPELEIYADDVACSHGSTSGAIDDTALFYLRSRGVPHAQAIDLLVLAFLAEALDEIADEDLADDLREQLTIWLKR